MELDHVVIAVTDLPTAAREFESRYGLASVGGGRHPGWGTANRIVPLGDAYLELIAVVDEEEAAKSLIGRWVSGAHPKIARPLGWAVRTNELDEVAQRLGLTMHEGSRTRPDGKVLRWRSAGYERAAAEPCFPFFIEWGEGTLFPGRSPAAHPAGSARVMELRLAGDPERLTAWLGPHRMPIAVRAGAPAVTSVVLTGQSGEVVLGPDLG